MKEGKQEMFKTSTKGMGKLFQFVAKLDRWKIGMYLLGMVFFTLIVPPAFERLYTVQGERDALLQTVENPAMVAMIGPVYGEEYTTGIMFSHQMLTITGLVLAMVASFYVVTRTRGDEEEGRIGMIRSLTVGKLTNLNAVLLVYTLVHFFLAGIIGIGLWLLSIESMGIEGSFLYGALLGGTGLFFTGLSAIAAQLFPTKRGANGLVVTFILLFYMIRAIGDVTNETLSWFSPFGWLTKAEVYSANNWVSVLLLVGFSFLFYWLANALYALRDLESGIVPSKAGRRHASRLLRSPLGFVFHMQRTVMLGWVIGMFLIGAIYGSVLGELETLIESSELLRQAFLTEESFTAAEHFLTIIMMVMAIISTIPAVLTMTKFYSEEKKQRLQNLLVKPLSRLRLLSVFYFWSVVTGFVVLLASGMGVWVTGNASMDGSLELWSILKMILIYYPALLATVGGIVFLVGFFPKVTSLIWVYMFYSFVILYFNELFQFPDWISKLSAFSYIPQIPIEEFKLLPVAVLLILAVLLAIGGGVGYRRRDLMN